MTHYIMKTKMYQSNSEKDKSLELFMLASNLKIAALLLPGDTDFVVECAVSLAEYIKNNICEKYDTILTAEFKGAFLAQALSIELNNRGLISEKRFVIARKKRKIYMGETVSANIKTITTGENEYLYLSQSDAEYIKNKKILLVDDVISTGGAMRALACLAEKCGAKYYHKVCVAVEGTKTDSDDIITLAHIPLFDNDCNEIWN